MQVNNAAFEPMKRDVAAILSNRRANTRIQKFLDLIDDLGIGPVVFGLTELYRKRLRDRWRAARESESRSRTRSLRR